MQKGKFQISRSTTEDLGTLQRHRLKMFYEMKPDKNEYLPEFEAVTEQWIARKVKDQNYVALIARTEDGQVAGSGCLLVKEDQPRPGNLNLNAPYILSMYTEPEYRHMGVASLIIEKLISWAKQNGYDRIDLHASPLGRSLYEKFGFRQTNEMRLLL